LKTNPIVQIQAIDLPLLKEKGVQLFIQRDDTLHPHVSGNKWRKLKYNVLEAKQKGKTCLLTFGGAFSNHIAATAAAAQLAGMNSIGVIRGKDADPENSTLKFATSCGMQLQYVDRAEFRELRASGWKGVEVGNSEAVYVLPEGGSNDLAVKGCKEITGDWKEHYDFACCALGTGATFAGLVNGVSGDTHCLGFPAIKDQGYLSDEVSLFLEEPSRQNWELIREYHFGKYGKVNADLINFMNDFYIKTGIPLDPIYTGKMIYGLIDMIKNDYFNPGTKVIAIHTGGLQGNAGINMRLSKKGLQTLNYPISN